MKVQTEWSSMMIKRRAWFTQSSHHLTMGQHHYFQSSHHLIIIHLHVKKQAHSSVQLSLYHQARYAELEIMRWWRISRISKDVNQGSSIHHHMPFESKIYFHINIINFEKRNFLFHLVLSCTRWAVYVAAWCEKHRLVSSSYFGEIVENFPFKKLTDLSGESI